MFLAALALLSLSPPRLPQEPAPAASGFTNIVCLGGPGARGAGLPDQRLAWPAQLEQRLNAHQLRPVVAVDAHVLPTPGTPADPQLWFADSPSLAVIDLHGAGAADPPAEEAAWVAWLDACASRGLELLLLAPADADRAARLRALARPAARVHVIASPWPTSQGDAAAGPFAHEACARAVQAWLAPRLDLPFTAQASCQPAPAAEYRAGAGWQGDAWPAAFARLQNLGADHPRLPVVFLGDSITQSLTGDAARLAQPAGTRAFDQALGELGAVSLGLSGDRTEHLRYRIRHGALRWMSPQVVVLQIGINNLNAAGHSAAQTVAGIRAVLQDLRETQPFARVLLCGPFPAGRTPEDPLRQAVDQVHEELPALAADSALATLGWRPQVHYLDPRPLFLTADGTPGPGMAGDALHINQAGRRAWLDAVLPPIRAILDEPLLPGLPGELAWLVDNQDPLVSRRLMRLLPGAAGPERLAEPLLWSFDAADRQDLAPAARGWLVSGPRTDFRSAPNVGSPLQWIDVQASVHTLDRDAPWFAVAPDGRRVACLSPRGLRIWDLASGSSVERLPATAFARAWPMSLAWPAAERVELRLGRVAGAGEGGLDPGRWALDPNSDAPPSALPALPGRTLDRGPAGELLCAVPTGRGHFDPVRLELVPSDPAAAAQTLVEFAHARTEAAFLADGSLIWTDPAGRLRRSAGPQTAAALQRHLDPPQVLFEGMVRSFAVRADWIALVNQPAGSPPELHLLHLASGAQHALGPGRLPRWRQSDSD